jgi:hypothetical protein
LSRAQAQSFQASSFARLNPETGFISSSRPTLFGNLVGASDGQLMDKLNPAFVNTTSSTLLPQYSATPPPINPSTLSWIQTCQIKHGHPIVPEKQAAPQEPTKDTFSHLLSGNNLPNQAKIERRQVTN